MTQRDSLKDHGTALGRPYAVSDPRAFKAVTREECFSKRLILISMTVGFLLLILMGIGFAWASG